MRRYVAALCILALALVGVGIALDGTDIVEKQIEEPTKEICGEKYQAGYDAGYQAGYQAGKLAAYQELSRRVTDLINQLINELHQAQPAREWFTSIGETSQLQPAPQVETVIGPKEEHPHYPDYTPWPGPPNL